MFSLFGPSLFPSDGRPLIVADRYLATAHVIAILCLLIPNRTLRQSICVPALLTILYQLRVHTAGTVDGDYMTFLQVFWLLVRWTDFTILHTPETGLLRLQRDGKYETPEIVKTLPWYQKLWYSLSLLTTTRGPSWNWRVKNIKPVPTTITRGAFCLTQTALVAKYFLTLLAFSYARRFTSLDAVGLTSEGYTSYASLPISVQIWHTWLRLIQAASALCFAYHLPALICVGLCLSEPQDWPPCMSDWSEAYTLRNLWGKCYHQYLRRPFEQFNLLLLKLFRVKRGTLISRYVQLYGAFLFSALFHHTGALNLPYVVSVKYQFLFFMLQPVCITVEDVVVALGKKLGAQSARESIWMRVLGYVWVFVSLTWTTRYMAMYYTDTGLSRVKTPLADDLVDWWLRQK